MKVTTKKINSAVIFYLVIFLLLSGYIEYTAIWHLGIIAAYFAVFFANKYRKKFTLLEVSLDIYLLIFFILSVAVSDGLGGLGRNIRSMTYSLCAIGIFTIVFKSEENMIVEFLKNHIKLFNIVYVLNLLVLTIQTTGNRFMIKESWLSKNPYYEDQCAGLFGFNGTPILALYVCFVMILNFTYAQTECRNLILNKVIWIYTLATQMIMMVLATLSDNLGYFFEFAIFFICYAMLTNTISKDIVKKIVRVIMYAFIILFIFRILFSISGFQNFVDTTLIRRINLIINYREGASGSNERLAILEYALGELSTYVFGKGLGTCYLSELGAFGFAHFGISSIGSYVLLGGIWFFLGYLLFFTVSLYKITIGLHKKSKKIFGMNLVIMIFFTVYTAIFNQPRSVILLAMISSCFRMILENTDEEENALMHS